MTLGNQEKRAWAKALLVECPFDVELDSCPIRETRRLPLGERMALVNNMSDEEIGAIVQHHKDCQKKRLLREKPKKKRGKFRGV